MPDETLISSEWLGLTEAADRLGIHPATLRRWADGGEIPVLVTPGGHRRFVMADLDRFAEERRRQRVAAGIEQVLAEGALSKTRQQIDRHRDDPWMTAFDEVERAHKRELGQRLLKILLRYIALKEGGENLLEEARAIGRDHAESSLKLGMPLVETLTIVLFFRDTLFDVALHVPEVAHVKTEVNAQLLYRMGQLLSEMELAVAEVYDRARLKLLAATNG